MDTDSLHYPANDTMNMDSDALIKRIGYLGFW